MEFSNVALRGSTIRLAFLVFGLMAGSAALSASALAQNLTCGEDIKQLAEKRQVELDRMNNLVHAAKGKPVAPAVFCSQSAAINSAENALITYMEKNKDSCSVPDDMLRSLKANREKVLAFWKKNCET